MASNYNNAYINPEKSRSPLMFHLFGKLCSPFNTLTSLISLARSRMSALKRIHRRIGFLPCPLSPIDSVRQFLKDPLNTYLLKDCLIILSAILIKSTLFILTMLAFTISIFALVTSLIGCVAIINYAPRAERASLYTHEQSASNMVVNQEIPMTAQLANELSGIVGAQIKNNSMSSSIKGVEVQKPKIK